MLRRLVESLRAKIKILTKQLDGKVNADGTNAHGTWGIDVTGSAAKASKADSVDWNGITNKPSLMTTSGGALSGGIIMPSVGTSWVKGRTEAAIKMTASGNAYCPFLSAKTERGSWEFGTYVNDIAHFSYITDENYNKNNNVQSADIQFKSDGEIQATAFRGKLIGTADDALKVNGFTVGCNVPANAKFTDTNTTYSNFVKSGTGAKAGLVPAPSTTAGTTKYLREDGTWQVPPNTNTTYGNMTAATASAAGKAGLVPAPAAGKQASFLRGDGQWVVPTNTTYAAMKGATSAANGAAGLVPTPAKGKQGCFLRGDGAWVDIGSDITSASIKGKVITFTRRNGTTFTITLP